ncbi:hypothetical protein EDC01DRAFT_31013 [Geopyxis carbonaria]|nr:hypothetical protein EDC01DRAFT_31013 [Geopyxis carbonaria]
MRREAVGYGACAWSSSLAALVAVDAVLGRFLSCLYGVDFESMVRFLLSSVLGTKIGASVFVEPLNTAMNKEYHE